SSTTSSSTTRRATRLRRRSGSRGSCSCGWATPPTRGCRCRSSSRTTRHRARPHRRARSWPSSTSNFKGPQAWAIRAAAMRVIRHLAHVSPPLRRVVLTLGNFDGVHLGHQAIVRRAVSEARSIGGQVVVLTFHPHPVAVLAPERASPLLQSLRDRLALLRELGADVTVVQRFTPRFAALDPELFVREFLGEHLELLHVVVGYNVSFGHRRAGTVDTLRALGPSLGFAVDAVGPVTVGEE